uniref:NID domain-containing protein n=1 Tax=Neogobius melanostomus TaxID=47308 RepID=A0A8C6UUL4_9GOBI
MSELRHDADVHHKDGDAAEAKRELEQWKRKVETKDDNRSRLVLEKLDAEQEKKKSNNLMMELIKKQEGLQREQMQSSRTLQEQMSEVRKRKMELMEKLKRSRAQLQQKKAETQRLDNKFKIWAELPDTEVEFVKTKPDDDVTGDEPIRGQFCVCQEGALLLTGGQALITFEEEKVVSQLLQSGRCSVSFDDHTLEMTPKRIRTEPLVQFEIQLTVSRFLLNVTELDCSLPKQRVEERLELASVARAVEELRSNLCSLTHGNATPGSPLPNQEWQSG